MRATLKNITKYRLQMLEVIKSTVAKTEKQEKTEEQKEYWIALEVISSLFLELKQEAGHLYKKKEQNASDLQKYRILSLFLSFI